MVVISLDVKEREKFAAYLEQEAATNNGMAKEMEKIKVQEFVVKRMEMKAAACIIIANDLREIEDMKI